MPIKAQCVYTSHLFQVYAAWNMHRACHIHYVPSAVKKKGFLAHFLQFWQFTAIYGICNPLPMLIFF